MSEVYWREHPRSWPGKQGTAKTYFVQKTQRKGYFTSLHEAITKAEPYERIEVGPGTFFENVVLQKPLEITAGDSAGDRPELYSHGTTLTIDCEEAFIEGLSITTGDQGAYAVVVQSGKPIIMGCTLANVCITGSAEPILEKNKITNSKKHGVYIGGSAGGSIRSNTIEIHSWYSIWVESTGQPEFVTNYIQNGQHGQIMVSGQSAFFAEDFAFENASLGPNVTEGVLKDEVMPVFKGNRITDTVVQIVKKTEVQRKRSQIKEVGDAIDLGNFQIKQKQSNSSNEQPSTPLQYAADARIDELWKDRCAVEVKHNAKPIFERNWICDGIHNGVYFHSRGGGVFVQNKISRNAGSGICVSSKSNPSILDNDIVGNQLSGMILLQDHAAKVEGNTIDCNGPFGIKVCRGAMFLHSNPSRTSLITKNIISNHDRVGILCTDTSVARIEKNEIRENGIGVVCESLAAPRVIQNLIKNNKNGVVVCSQGRGLFIENDITSNEKDGITISSLGHPQVQRNRLCGNKHNIRITSKGRGYLEDNYIRDAKGSQIIISGLAAPKVISNQIVCGKDAGVTFLSEGLGYFSKNVIANHVSNVVVSDRSDPLITGNLIMNSQGENIIIKNCGFGTYTHNCIQGGPVGISVIGQEGNRQSQQSATIRRNQIQCHSVAGISIKNSPAVTVEKNYIRKNGYAFQISSGDQPTSENSYKTNIVRNEINNPIWIRDKGTTPTIDRNIIKHQLIIEGRSSPFVIGNEFTPQTSVYYNNNGQGCLIANVFDGATIKVTGNSSPVISKNMITGSSSSVILTESSGLFHQNIIFGCKDNPGLTVGRACTTEIASNIFTCNNTGVVVEDGAASQFIYNVVMGNKEVGIHVSGDGSNFKLINNTICEQPVGVLVDGAITCCKNIIFNNTEVNCKIIGALTVSIPSSSVNSSPLNTPVTGELSLKLSDLDNSDKVISKTESNLQQGSTISIIETVESERIITKSRSTAEGSIRRNGSNTSVKGTPQEVKKQSQQKSETTRRKQPDPKHLQNDSSHLRKKGSAVSVADDPLTLKNRGSNVSFRCDSPVEAVVRDPNLVRQRSLASFCSDRRHRGNNSRQSSSGSLFATEGHSQSSFSATNSSSRKILRNTSETKNVPQNAIAPEAPNPRPLGGPRSASGPRMPPDHIKKEKSPSQDSISIRRVAEELLIRGNGLKKLAHINENIIRNSQCGIVSDDDGAALITNNLIIENQTGVTLGGSSSPQIIGNTIKHNQECGLLFRDSSSATVKNNVITDNSTNIRIMGGTDTGLIENNVVQDAKVGILADQGGATVVNENIISKHSVHGIHLRNGGFTVFSNNKISDHKQSGIFAQGGEAELSERTFQKLYGNRIMHNSTGVLTERFANPHFLDNEISFSSVAGVKSESNGRGVFSRNRVKKNRIGFLISHSAPELHHNRVTENDPHGIIVEGISDDNQQANISSNDITLNKLSGLTVRRKGDPLVANNKICGLIIEKGGSGTFRRNKMVTATTNNTPQIRVEGEGSNPIITEMEISSSKSHGVQIRGGARGVLSNCIIENNEFCGIEVTDDADPVIEHNIFRHNGQQGVTITLGCRGLVQFNTIHNNNGGGLHMRASSTAIITNNTIHSEPRGGILVTGSSGTISKNTIHSCKQHGVAFRGSTDSVFKHNIVHSQIGVFAGVLLEQGATPIITQNLFFNNSFSGIQCKGCSPAEISENVFMQELTHGIHVCASEIGPPGKGLTVTKNVFADCLSSADGMLHCQEADGLIVKKNMFVDRESNKRSGAAIVLSKCSSEVRIQDNLISVTPSSSLNSVSQSSISSTVKNCSGIGIHTTDDCSATISGNLYWNVPQGIVIDDSSSPLISDEDIVHSSVVAVQSQTAGNPTLQNIVVRSSRLHGVIVSEGTLGVRDCTFVGNSIGAECRNGILKCSNSTFRDNKTAIAFENDNEKRKDVLEASEVSIKSSIIDVPQIVSSNIMYNGIGVSIRTKSDPLIEMCSIHRNTKIGVHVCNSGAGKVTKCEVFANDECIVVDDGTACFVDNHINNARKNGVRVSGGQPTFEGNQIYDAQDQSFLVDGGMPTLACNKIFYPREAGALRVSENANALSKNNTVLNHQAPVINGFSAQDRKIKIDKEGHTFERQRQTQNKKNARKREVIMNLILEFEIIYCGFVNEEGLPREAYFDLESRSSVSKEGDDVTQRDSLDFSSRVTQNETLFQLIKKSLSMIGGLVRNQTVDGAGGRSLVPTPPRRSTVTDNSPRNRSRSVALQGNSSATPKRPIARTRQSMTTESGPMTPPPVAPSVPPSAPQPKKIRSRSVTVSETGGIRNRLGGSRSQLPNISNRRRSTVKQTANQRKQSRNNLLNKIPRLGSVDHSDVGADAEECSLPYCESDGGFDNSSLPLLPPPLESPLGIASNASFRDSPDSD